MPAIARGRPRAVSRMMLQEAAFECFLERGYAKTTIEHIATRAGVSRATFFNYFASKSEVFWIEFETALEVLRTSLVDHPLTASPMAAARAAILEAAATIKPGNALWPLTQHWLIGADDELRADAARLVASQHPVLSAAIAARAAPGTQALVEPAAAAILGASIAAIASWASDGVDRGPLVPRLELAISPVCEGFEPEFRKRES